MRPGKSHQEDEEEDDEEIGTKKTKNGKNNDKANATRSKHSVTEQRRRSKINERFQILRELIPHCDQKRDTASVLLEVIQYVQFLQEKLQKYEGPYQSLNLEPTKLMPWRNSHWHVHSHVGQAQAMKNGSGSTFPCRLDENNVRGVPSTMQASHQNPIELEPSGNASGRAVDPQAELADEAMAIPVSLQASMPACIPNDGAFSQTLPKSASVVQSTEDRTASGIMNQEELSVEGGTISISNVYSQRFLNSLTQALESTGVDLSEARMSVQINLGKCANRGSTSGISNAMDHENPMPSGDKSEGHFQDASNSEDADVARKRQKI
ncbi:transcription factor BIM2-like isoform X2 [Olea europaea var. sylvestris]|uniref:transcription factor BIM2-like isoform X2 n=1 Tax=Olea europaea var. sylvestris TaxID=158386 RepID=UPI000C1D4BE6|nr:transcription factor BIM2-like isoform X2 [Olea europaea var. sylvestris]XP_022891200.1 transcription factor BIM2-like isoform X2 [Olea europaea var. sylvestris]